MKLTKSALFNYLPLITAVMAFTSEFIRQIIVILDPGTDTSTVFPLFLLASVLISISALLIRFLVLDKDKFAEIIQETDIITGKNLKTQRFVNFMPLAMIVCTTADALIAVDFIYGMLTFTVAQLLYIFAYTGIVHLDLGSLLSEQNRLFNIASTVFWFLIAAGIYFLFIFSLDNIMTLAVIPYVIVLTVMVLITTIAFMYSGRSINFRLMLLLGAMSFLFSDTILAINRFNDSISFPGMSIGLTYLIAVYLLQIAVLRLQSPDGKTAIKHDEQRE